MTPNLIPRFRSFKDLADLINTSLDDAGYGSITVDFIYVPKEQDDDQPRFEVFIEFSTTLSVSVGLDATYEVSLNFGIPYHCWN